MEDEDIILAAVSMVSAATAIHLNHELSFDTVKTPQPRFIRPDVPYMAFLETQEAMLPDHGDRIIYDTFRMSSTELSALVEMATPYISPRLNAKHVVATALHWLATGASVRAQEQFFMDKSYSVIHEYRTIGMKAILQALIEYGFYGDNINDADRLKKSSDTFMQKDPSLHGCVGAIDGTHIPIVVPHEMVDRYRNRYEQVLHNWLNYLT
jgi:hypothetical protein